MNIPFKKTTGYVVRNYMQKIGIKLVDRVMITELLEQDKHIAGAVGIAADTDDTYVFESKTTVFRISECPKDAIVITPDKYTPYFTSMG